MTSPGDPFVGRRKELAELRAGLGEASAGNGRLFLISGEAGIGKTRLAEELAAHAEAEGATALWGRCWEGDGGPALWPWRQCLRSYVAGSESSAPSSSIRDSIAVLGELVPEIRDKVPGAVTVSLPSDPDAARSLLFDAAVSFVREVSSTRPLLLVFDDLHWADKLSLLLIRFLARNLRGTRTLLYGAYRDLERRSATAVDEVLADLARETRRLTLRGLSPEELQELIARAGAQAVSATLAARIHAATEGNPFFVTELMRLLAAEAPVAEWERLFDGTLPIPTAVRTAVRRHLASLSAEAREILGVGAVVGREFELSHVERALERKAPILEPVGEALWAGIVTRVSRTLDRYRFVHALVRETLYDDLRPAERALLHQKVGRALEASHVGKALPLANLAHHYFEAAPLGEVDRAIDYAKRAADEAIAMVAYEEAVRHLERALVLIGRREVPDHAERFEVLLRLGHALWGFDLPRSKEVFLEAARLGEELGDPQRFARAILGIGGKTAAAHSGVLDLEFITLLERAYVALGEEESALRASLAANLGSALHFSASGQDEKARAFGSEGLRIARIAGDKRVLLEALIKNMWWMLTPDESQKCLSAAREIVELGTELRDDLSRQTGHHFAFIHFLELGGVDDAHREADRSVASKDADSFGRLAPLSIAGVRAAIEGSFDEAEEIAIRIRALAEETRNALAAQVALIQIVHVRRTQGRLEDVVDEVCLVAERLPLLPFHRCCHLWILAELGRERAARRMLDGMARDDFAEVPRDHMWVAKICLIAEAAAILADAPRAAALCALLEPYRERIALAVTYACFGPVARYLALLETCRARFDEAEKHFATALEKSALIRSRPWTAHTQHDYARMLLARRAPGDEVKARELVAQALSAARELGMKALENELLAIPEVSKVPTQAAENFFRQEGEIWTIGFSGPTYRLRDAKGLRYIATLLSQPGVEIHAADLAGVGRTAVTGHAGEVIDRRSREAYRRRLQELREEADEAERFNDRGRAAKARAEIEAISAELAAAFGLGSRSRRASSDAERARLMVTQRIKAAIRKIGEADPALEAHMRKAIRTGMFCRYEPDAPIIWRL